MVALPEVDQVMVALMGAVGLSPTLAALRAGKQVALSNKEPIVMAGPMLKAAEAKHGGVILPVDSEPSAIWQCLQGEDNHIRRLLITASGGPFRRTPLDQLDSVTPEQALRHPTWQMGAKITIDSATLMNKAFEVIESHWLFGVPWDDIAVLVHPQSTIHSMVEFDDGSVKAQLGPPSMRLPIQYALFYPKRFPNAAIPRLDIAAPWSLDFEPLPPERYPCFDLAVAAGRAGGAMPAVLSAADEVAVAAFLQRRIGFTGIHRVVAQTLSEYGNQTSSAPDCDLDAIRAADLWAAARARELAGLPALKTAPKPEPGLTRRPPGASPPTDAIAPAGAPVVIMDTWLINLASVIPMLLLLVVIHELGHFWTAKAFGIKVLEFGVGFPPRAFGIYTGRSELLLDSATVILNGTLADLRPGQLLSVLSGETGEGQLVARYIELPTPRSAGGSNNNGNGSSSGLLAKLRGFAVRTPPELRPPPASERRRRQRSASGTRAACGKSETAASSWPI